MKKKLIALSLALVMCLAFVACGDGDNSDTQSPPDLTGTWLPDDYKTAEMYQEAIINGDTITVNWVSTEDDTKMLYWAGTYVAPTDAGSSYSWDSTADHEQTDLSLFASSDDTKTFTYDNGKLSYTASGFGVSKTIELKKQ